MVKILNSLYQLLYRMVGLHRRLLETVRAEKEALISSESKRIEEVTHSKEILIADIAKLEGERLKIHRMLQEIWKKNAAELTLPKIIVEIQESHPDLGSQLHGVYTTLKVLIKRVQEQNRENENLVKSSLEHISEMKKNALGATSASSQTYSRKGEIQGQDQSKFLSKEI